MNYEDMKNMSDDEIIKCVKAGIYDITWDVNDAQVKRFDTLKAVACRLKMSMKTWPNIENAKAEVIVREDSVQTQTTCGDALSYPMFDKNKIYQAFVDSQPSM